MFPVLIQVVIDSLMHVMGVRYRVTVPAIIGMQVKATQRDRKKRYAAEGKYQFGKMTHKLTIHRNTHRVSKNQVQHHQRYDKEHDRHHATDAQEV